LKPEFEIIIYLTGELTWVKRQSRHTGKIKRVTVSYFKWVQNLEREHWTLEEVNRKLESKMAKVFNDVYEIAKKGQTCELQH